MAWELSSNEFDWLAARLSIAVYDTNRINPEMAMWELQQAFPGLQTISRAANGNQILHFAGKDIEVGPMASNEEIAIALQNPWIKTENTKVTATIGDQLKAARAQIAEARQSAASAIAETAAATGLVKDEAAKLAKEAKDIRDEVAGLNGGPA